MLPMSSRDWTGITAPFSRSPSASRSSRTGSTPRCQSRIAKSPDGEGRARSAGRGGVTGIEVTIGRTDVGRLGSDQPSVAKLLQAMCGPADDSADGERRREQVGRPSQAMEQERRVELDIGFDATLRLTFAEQTKRGGFDLAREVVEALIAPARIEALGGLGEDVGAGVPDSIDAMSESHETLAPLQFGADDGFRALLRADFEYHVERWPGCAAMQRTLERADGAGDR